MDARKGRDWAERQGSVYDSLAARRRARTLNVA